MTVLSLVWVALMILEFSGYGNATLQSLGLFIWALFLVQFALEFWIAPNKWIYLRKNWLTTIALHITGFPLTASIPCASSVAFSQSQSGRRAFALAKRR